MLKSDWRQGRHLFHLHTSYTDGALSVAQYAEFAKGAGVNSLVFLEHIRREPGYDVDRLSTDVKLAGGGSVQTVLGFEAKLLPDGTLDISAACLEIATVIGIAEHAFPDDRGLLRDTFLNVIRTYPCRWPHVTFVWVHPGLWYLKRRLPCEGDETFHQMLAEACTAGVLIEQNLRYSLPNRTTTGTLPAKSLVTGVDAHSLLDLERWAAQFPAETIAENRLGVALGTMRKPDAEWGVALP